MLAIISLIFLFIVLGQFEANMISTSQVIIYSIYGLMMFYHTSKPYWNYKDVNMKTKNNRRD